MKKFLKILAWIVGILVVLLIILIIGVKLFFPVEKAKALIIEQAQEQLNRPIDIGDVDVSVWGGLGVNLHEVVLGNPPHMEDDTALLQAQNVDVKLQLFPLLFGEYRLDKVIINEPSIYMHKREDGASNYAFELAGADAEGAPARVTDEAKAAAAAVSFDNLEIRNGDLTYVDDSSDMRVQLVGLNLATSLANPMENKFQSRGRLSIEQVESGGAFPFPPAPVELSWQADYDYARKFLSLQEAELRLGNLEFAIDADLSHANDSMVIRAGMEAEQIKVVDLFSLAPPDQLTALEGFSIEGNFSFTADLTYDAAAEMPFTYSGTAIITSLDMAYEEIDGTLHLDKALIDFKPDNLRLNIENGSFADKPLTGHLVVDNFEDPHVNGELGGEVDLRFAQPFLPAEDDHNVEGMARVSIKVSGQANKPKELTLTGSLKIPRGRYNSQLIPEAIDSFSVDAYFDNRVTRINQLDLATASSRLAFQGRFTDLLPYLLADSTEVEHIDPTIDGTLKGNVNLELANHFWPPESATKVGGDMQVDVSILSSILHPSTVKPRGQVTVTNGSYSDTMLSEPITNFTTELVVSPDTFWINQLDIQFVSSDLGLTGTVIRPIPYLLPIDSAARSRLKKPLFLFELTSHRFNVDSLFPEAAPGNGLRADSLAYLPQDSTELMAFPDILGRGTMKLDTVVYSQVDFTDITGDIEIKDRRIMCTDVTGDVYSGDVSGEITIDLSNPRKPVYTGEYHATAIEADDFVSRFTGFGGIVTGKFELDGTFNAAGWEPEQFLHSLSMNGKALMRDGRLFVAGPAFNALSDLSDHLNTDFDPEQDLKNLKTGIQVNDGKVMLDRMDAKLGSLGDLQLNGYYSFENNVAYSGSITLSPEMTGKLMSNKGLLGALSGLLNNDNANRIQLPFSVQGTISSPDIKLDYSALTDKAQDEMKDKASDLLKGIFDKD